MKQYKKPLMKIVELEKVDVLTCSKGYCLEHNSHSQCIASQDNGDSCGCDALSE